MAWIKGRRLFIASIERFVDGPLEFEVNYDIIPPRLTKSTTGGKILRDLEERRR